METEFIKGEGFSASVTLDAGLYHALEKRVRAQLNAQGETPKLLRDLADVLRAQGDLREATEVLDRVTALDPSCPKTHYMCAALRGDVTGLKLPDGAVSVPVAVIPDAFPQKVYEILFAEATRSEEEYVEDKVVINGMATCDRKFRYSYRKQLSREYEDLYLTHLMPLLEKTVPKLGIGWPTARPPSKKFSLCRHGAYFLPHQDHGYHDRMVSIVYHMHQLPRMFKGGQLAVFDTDYETKQALDKFTLYDFQPNMLAIFPSWAMHEVLPVSLPNDEFQHGRFAVVSHC
ncbi:hypothetical protein UF64_06920 [Thalassospira sp. HJ]|uniref:2OG-Fe(II) oxygenase n=1 Tax=Thalassospira sp. HJ TaxID=1616823 RepID=UPI0005CF12F6|nr:2OG-Fe(II) oxygenase [Thalassospira sp. HJ]KJE35839.1 hypothetical protein UF64_06920 [Thalassospira sp. HJ]